MPAQPLFSTGSRLREVNLRLEDCTLDLIDGVRVTLTLVFDDGDRATVVSRIVMGEAAGDLPDAMKGLGDAFMWGEQPQAVLKWAQALDTSAQSARVRRGL